jgi:hypothetical protein
MIDLLADTGATLAYLRQLLGLQLFTGPYIGGSFLTYHFEKQYRETIWIPKDIDIICKNVDQFDYIKSVLGPSASAVVNEKFKGLPVAEFYFPGQPTYIGIAVIPNLLDTFGDTNRQFGEFTVNSFFSDGRDIKCDLRAWHDIEHGILQLREPEKCVPGLVHPKQLKRLNKYQSRGFVDHGGTTEAIVKNALGLL